MRQQLVVQISLLLISASPSLLMVTPFQGHTTNYTGASLHDTTFQVIHATAAGFMYAALRLRIGAIWSVMLFNALWDFCLFDIDTLTKSITATSFPSPPGFLQS